MVNPEIGLCCCCNMFCEICDNGDCERETLVVEGGIVGVAMEVDRSDVELRVVRPRVELTIFKGDALTEATIDDDDIGPVLGFIAGSLSPPLALLVESCKPCPARVGVCSFNPPEVWLAEV